MTWDLVTTVKELVRSNAPSGSRPSTSTAIAEMNRLTRELSELKNMGDTSEITKTSIKLTEAALLKAQTLCADLLNSGN